MLDRVAGPDAAALGLPAGFFGDAFQRKLRVSQERGVILAEVVDRAIIDDGDIRQIGAELGELISAGQSRIALNLGNVEHLSSRAVGTVLKVHRRCRDQGGMLKICGVRPQVAEIFALTNLARHIEIFPDELPALESYWPGRPSAPKPEPTAKLPSAATPAAPAQKASARVRLIVETGKAKGQAIRIGISRFLIGRDPRCHLRPNSETISRLHAVIEQREGRVFVRDCGTVNGTLLGDRTLRQEEAEAHDGDSLGVGVLRFRFSITPRAEGPAPPQGSPTIEDQMTAWLLGQDKTDPNADTAQIPTFDPNAPDQR
ncbi:MAG: FHA domain-containing protein [Isosphaeraceae bacterium]|nr:FHA domain-containing protein [Isosphaeraceae bacterium]